MRLLVIVVDAFSKWTELLEMSSGASSKSLIYKLRIIFTRFGLPRTIASDNDLKIISQEFSSFCSSNGIQHITIPIYHPNSNGESRQLVL